MVQKGASMDAVNSFVEFFEYIKKGTPDIVSDAEAQEKFLTKSLRRDLAGYEQRAGSPESNPDYPRNSFFLGVWNRPTTYSIVSAREYDYRKGPCSIRTVIDVLYEWGYESTIQNQYPGVRNMHSFMFVLEDDRWKLEDIYIFGDPYTSPQSLSQLLRETSKN
jgi:hypothetical protein